MPVILTVAIVAIALVITVVTAVIVIDGIGVGVAVSVAVTIADADPFGVVVVVYKWWLLLPSSMPSWSSVLLPTARMFGDRTLALGNSGFFAFASACCRSSLGSSMLLVFFATLDGSTVCSKTSHCLA